MQATILIIDDNDDVREMTKMGLQTFGHRVHTAADGRSGLAAFKAERPDLLVIDYILPGMTGTEVMEEARELWPNIPVIFITAYDRFFDLGVRVEENAALVRKPFQLTELNQLIDDMLLKAAQAE